MLNASNFVISSFNELFIGDLAFLAMLIGMNHSAGSHCLMCLMKASEFNSTSNELNLRTKQSVAASLEKYKKLVEEKAKPPPNYNGVNEDGLWDIDPQRILIPILHCPMGLVDKILELFKIWVNLAVENLESENARARFQLATQQHKAAVVAAEQARAFALLNPTLPEAKQRKKDTERVRIDAAKAATLASRPYDELMQLHNVKRASLNQKFEVIYRRNGVKREHYHGGKFNGVNCIRIMEKSRELFIGTLEAPGFLYACLEQKEQTMTEERVMVATCSEYCRLLGLLDLIWSTVRGLEAGLLPTLEQTTSLENALSEAKKLWLTMKLSTRQPKWHLTFDGHLLRQFKKYGGLADKSDESIEKGHQTLKLMRDRFRGVASFELRESCIRRELRRTRSPEIQKHIDNYENSIKQASGTKREVETAERQEQNKKVKLEKRLDCITN